MSVHPMHSWCSSRSEKGSRFFKTGVTDGCEPSVDVINQMQVLCKSNKYFKPQNILPATPNLL